MSNANPMSSDYLNTSRHELDRASDDFFNWQYFEYLIKEDTVFSYAPDIARDHYIASILERDPPLGVLNTNSTSLRKLNNQISKS